MNAENFEERLVEKLTPRLTPQSVIVLDNAAYHCPHSDKSLSAYAINTDMISWFHKRGVNCNTTMQKKISCITLSSY
jgi:predicted O-methyltransferase YrrM